MPSAPCIELDSNQLSLVFIIQEASSRVMGDSFSLSYLEVFGPFFVSYKGGDFQNFSTTVPNVILEGKTIFQFSASVFERTEFDCDTIISIIGLIIGFFKDDLFFVEEVLINDGVETHHISFSEEFSSVSEPISIH
jgi:hypothetical protein